MKTMKLYEIGSELRAIIDAVDPDTGELTEEQAAQLDALEGAFEQKCESVAFVVRELTAEADAIKAEADRLAKSARARRNSAKRLKDYLLSEMQRQNVPKVKGEILTIRRQLSPARVKIEDERLLLAEYWIQPPPIISTADIKRALMAGTKISGASLERSEHIRIR